MGVTHIELGYSFRIPRRRGLGRQISVDSPAASPAKAAVLTWVWFENSCVSSAGEPRHHNAQV